MTKSVSLQMQPNKITNSEAVNKSNNSSPLHTYLNNVRIVMVNTTLPANIGSAARAMLTMGLTDLVVVNPKHPIDDDSVAHAAGAKSVLDNCAVVDTLDEAIADCHLIFAASSRQRHIPRPVVTPDEAAQLILKRPVSETKVAVLFGREDRGLTNEELALADYHIQIDANPDYPVLNVASAIQVISGFFYSRFLQQSNSETHQANGRADKEDTDIEVMIRQKWDAPAVNQQQKLSLQSRIIALMHDLELVDSTESDKLRDLPSRLSRLLSRLQLDQKEYELVSSVIAKVKRRL